MTSPNQADPAWMELVGLGAFQLGGTGGGSGLGSFGQSVTSTEVTQIIAGPATALMNLSGVTAQSDVLTMVSNYLSTLPLQALQMFQGFLPGKTAADFVDVPTAVTTIMNALGLGAISNASKAFASLMTDLVVLFDIFHLTYQVGTSADPPGTLGTNGKVTWYACWNDVLSMVGLWTNTSTPTTPAPTFGSTITRVITDLEILFDVFHITYQAGTSGDAPTALGTNGKRTWYSAWNDLLQVIGLSTGTTPTSSAPTIGTAITDAKTWATRLTNDILVLLDVFHLTYTSTQWNAAWTDLLSLFGIVNSTSTPTNPTPTIGPAITSAQSSATTAGTNASTALTNAGTAQSWATRLTNDLTILLDVFHITYTSTQWNNAWSDLMVLLGVVNSVTTPTNPSPTIGSSITSAQASATTATTNAATAQTTANTGVTNAATAQSAATSAATAASGAQTTATTGNTNTGTFLGYTRILADVFHLTYNVGSSSDTPTTLGVGGVGAGKPTWYSAWNGLLVLEGLVKATTAPADTAPTTGTVIQANTATANTASTNASIAISNASAANTLAQGTVDGLYQAFNGGSTTGNAVSTVKAGATAIPAANVVGLVGATVTFGAVGAGNVTTGATTTLSASETHSILSTDLGVLVFVNYFAAATTTWATTVTYGGVAMTQIGPPQQSSTFSGGGALIQEVWWLKSPATGAKTVAATVTRTGGATGNVSALGINSVSYLASKIATITAHTGGGSTSLSMTGSSVAGNMLVGSFFVGNSTTLTQSAFNQTSRWATTWFTNVGTVIGDAAGASSVTFSETINSATGAQWVGYIVELSN